MGVPRRLRGRHRPANLSVVGETILIADSQRLFAEAVAVSLSARGFSPVPGFPLTSGDVVDAVKEVRPDAVLMDFWIRGNSTDAARDIRRESPETVVLMTSWVHGIHQIEASIGAGAHGFLPKSLGLDWVVEGIQRARAGESPVYAKELDRLIEAIDWHKLEAARDQRRFSRLTAREVEVLVLLTQGDRADGIAAKLFISEGTAENHISGILKKLGVHSAQEAVRVARRWAWFGVQPPRSRKPLAAGAPPARAEGAVPAAGAGLDRAKGTVLHRSPQEGPISVLIADEQRLMAETLAEAVGRFPDIDVMGAFFGDGQAAVQAAIKAPPDVVVYDYWMPGTTGPAAARFLRSASPRSSVVLLSWLHGRKQLVEAMASGADAFIAKRVTLAHLVQAIRGVRRGALQVRPGERVPAVFFAPEPSWDRLRTLSPRELEVLHALCLGRSVSQICQDIQIAQGTLRNHIQSVLRKIGAKNKFEAVEIARREGLVREQGPPELW